MRGPGEFAKLVHAGGALVEFDQRRINGGQVQRGIGTAETPEARIGGGRGMDRQQMQDAAAELIDDVRQLAGEVAKLAGRRNDGEILPIQLLELGFEFFIVGGRADFVVGPNRRVKAQ